MQRPGVLRDLCVVLRPGLVEQVANVFVGQSVDHPRLADHALAAAVRDFLQQPLEILLGLLPGRQRVDGVLHCHRAQGLKAAPDLDPEIRRFGRKLVDQQEPAISRRRRLVIHGESVSSHL